MLNRWQDVFDSDYPAVRLRDAADARRSIARQRRWLRGTVRLALGRIVTEAEHLARRERAARLPL